MRDHSRLEAAKKARYGRWELVEKYDRHLGVYADATDREVVGRFFRGESGLILDVPCGTGRFAGSLDGPRSRTVRCDYSSAMLGAALARKLDRLVRGDVFRLPFSDATFDCVLCARLLFHFADPEPILAELSRVLKRGGVLVFDTLNPGSLRHALEPVARCLPGGEERRNSFLGRAQLELLLDRLGCEIVEYEAHLLFPSRAYRLIPSFLHDTLRRLEGRASSKRRVLCYWKARLVR